MEFMNWLVFSKAFLGLLFVGSSIGQRCQSTRPILNNCECHFIGACDFTKSPPKKVKNLVSAQPTGITKFARNTRRPHVTTICEGQRKSLAIFYDCDLRIPLVSARTLSDADIKARYSAVSQRTGFRETSYITSQFRQKNGDYGPNGLDQIPCYETTRNGRMKYLYDKKWYPRSKGGACNLNIGKIKKFRTPINKGHLIASSYGKASRNSGQSIRDTFTLSNMVPQFEEMNTKSWNRAEQQLLNWAKLSCASTVKTRKNGRLFIVVGAIPSTYGRFPKRYFGYVGFSNFQDRRSKKNFRATGRTVYKREYRINVPAVMWTAACCEYLEQNKKTKKWSKKYINKAFWGENTPVKGTPVYPVAVSRLFSSICATTNTKPCPRITVFPLVNACNK